MSPEWAGMILTACGLLSGGCFKLWTALRSSRDKAIAEALERGRTDARNEALIREAQATVAQKNAELASLQAINVRQSQRIDELLSMLRRIQERSG